MRLSQLKYTVLPTAPPIPTILDVTNNRKSLTMHYSPYGAPKSRVSFYQCHPGATLPIRLVVVELPPFFVQVLHPLFIEPLQG